MDYDNYDKLEVDLWENSGMYFQMNGLWKIRRDSDF